MKNNKKFLRFLVFEMWSIWYTLKSEKYDQNFFFRPISMKKCSGTFQTIFRKKVLVLRKKKIDEKMFENLSNFFLSNLFFLRGATIYNRRSSCLTSLSSISRLFLLCSLSLLLLVDMRVKGNRQSSSSPVSSSSSPFVTSFWRTRQLKAIIIII